MWTFQAPPQTLQPLYLPTIQSHHHHPSATLRTPSATATATSTTTATNKLIQSLCKNNNLKQALQLLPQEPHPTQHTYELLLLSCTQNNSLSGGLSVHQNLISDGYDQDPFLATKLINMYSELKSIHHAHQVFDKIRKRTIYVYNAFFRALTLAGHGKEAFEHYRRMNFSGIPSDRFTYTYILKACVASDSPFSLLEKGKEIHAHVFRNGYETNVHIMTTLIDTYAKFGCVNTARRVFDQMVEKNVVSWSAMIACYTKNKVPFEGLELFRNMMMTMIEIHGLVPNSITMVSVLQACASLSALQQGKSIHGYILRNRLNSILPVMNSLVAMYARSGELEQANKIFDRMERRDVVSWNTMFSGYGIHGMGKKAIEIFEKMLVDDVSPSAVTFVSLLGACSHSGLVEEGKHLFKSMTKDFKIYPIVEHYASMVDLLGRANRLEEATKIIEDMRIEPGHKVWGSLLGSCRIHGNVELAERASQRLFELEPKNAGNYVLMADVYAKAGRWEDVKRVKTMLESQGLEKVSGCSWIEVNRKIYGLTSVDELNPRIEQIHAFIMKLTSDMKGKGYVPETKIVLYDVDEEEKERILLGHSEKLAVAFGLISSSNGERIRITKNLRLCEDCHSFTKFVSLYVNREILVRDVNRFHRFKNGACSCGDYW